MKQLFLVIVLVLILVSSCSTTQTKEILTEKEIMEESNKNNNSNPIRIITFGDSLTYGYGVDREEAYPAQLEENLRKKEYNAIVVNSGYSGETSTGALNRVAWVIERSKPDIVILTTGANDAIRGIDLSITKSNIELIVDSLQNNNITVILSGMEIYDNLGEKYTNEFKGIYPQIVLEKNISFIPLFLEGVAANSSLNIDDQIHPNQKGYEKIVEQNILPVLEPLLKR